MIDKKYICIKSFEDDNGVVENGKTYLLVKSGRYPDSWYVILGSDKDGVWIFGPAIQESKVSEYFISLDEWRDKQINSIFNDY